MVRNFYINARIDGRITPLAGGPPYREGGFDLVITQRHLGTIQDSCTIVGRCLPDGSLILTIDPSSSLEVTTSDSGLTTICSKR